MFQTDNTDKGRGPHKCHRNNENDKSSENKGVATGWSWGARDPPFCKPLLTKQPTTGGENAMTISWP